MAIDLNALVSQASAQFNVPTNIINGVIQTESGGDPNAISSAGAIGLMQLMPATAAQLGVNANDPAQNVMGGTDYLAQLFGRYGNWTDALAAYNAGSPSSSAGQAYAAKVLAAAGGITPDQVAAGSPGTATPSQVTGSGAPSIGFYLIAIVLIIALVSFGLYGLIREG